MSAACFFVGIVFGTILGFLLVAVLAANGDDDE